MPLEAEADALPAQSASSPRNPDSLLQAAQGLLDQEHFDDAKVAVTQCLVRDPGAPNAYLLRGKIHLKLEMYLQAAADFTRHLQADPKSQEAHENLEALKTLIKPEDIEEAARSLDTGSGATASVKPSLAAAAEPAISEAQYEAAAAEIATKDRQSLADSLCEAKPQARQCYLDLYMPISSETDLADFTVHSMSEGKLRLAFRNGKARQAAIAYLANTQPEGTVDVVNVPRGRRLQTEGFEPGAYLETGPLAKAITKSAFTKLVRDILTNVKSEAPRDGQDANSDTVRMESAALHTLKEVSETMLTRLFEDCQTFATHAKRKTIFVSDLTLAKRCHRWAKQCFYRGLDIAHCSLLLLQGRGSVIILWSWSGLSFVLGQSHDVNRFSWFLRRHHISVWNSEIRPKDPEIL